MPAARWPETRQLRTIRILSHPPHLAGARRLTLGKPMKIARLRADILAGLTSSFALVPECIAFALVAQLNPLMGLYGAFIICTITALFGGRPGMISGAAG